MEEKMKLNTTRFALIALSLMWAASASVAHADTMQNAAGNTIVVTMSDGGVARYFMNADSTYSAAMPDGSVVRGAWRVSGAEVCLTPAGGQEGCAPHVPGKNVGDTWTQTAPDGSAITMSIEAGRNGAP
jgi:hypothetical protein